MATWFLILDEVDQQLLHALLIRRGRVVDRTMAALTHLGDPPLAVAVALLLFVVPLPLSPLVPLQALAAFVTSHLLVQMLKRVARRPRPRLPVDLPSLVDAPDRFSFPSGHAAAALSLALPVALAFPLTAALVLLGVAVLVGVSRCYLGIHYPGDVVAGWGLAGICSAGADWILPRLIWLL